MNEIWQDIPGSEGFYQASTLGRIRSVDRQIHNYIKPGRVLKPQHHTSGYFSVNIYLNGNNVKHAYIHRLVALTFVPNPNQYEQVNHKDFNKKNNIADNLEWVSPHQNILHFRQSKMAIKSDKNKRRNLANRSLNYILEHRDDVLSLYETGLTIQDVSKSLGLGKDRVHDILMIYGKV